MIEQHHVKDKFIELWNSNHEIKIDVPILNEMIYSDTKNEITKEFYETRDKLYIQMCKEEQNDMRKNIKQILMGKVIKNYDNNKCPLCVLCHPDVNAGIFFMNWRDVDVNQYLETLQIPIIVPQSIVKDHFEHIFVENECVADTKESLKKELEDVKQFKNIINVTDVELITHRINVLTGILNKMEKNNMTGYRQYKELSSELTNLIETKNKIVNGEKLNISGKLDASDVLKKILNVDTEKEKE